MPVAVYNPKHGASIRDFVWSKAKWNLGVNKILSFPDEVGEALLKTYDFLLKVDHKNIKEVKKNMVVNKYKCEYCKFETNTRVAYLNHKKTHKLSEEDKAVLGSIEQANPEGRYGMEEKITGTRLTQADIEKQEGITKEAGFYGPGLQNDTLTDMKIRKSGRDGNFGG